MTCFDFFDFGVFPLKISYLLQLKSFLVFTDRSKFFIFSNSTPIPSHLFLFPLEYILYFSNFTPIPSHLFLFPLEYILYFSNFTPIPSHLFLFPLEYILHFSNSTPIPPHLFLFPLEYNPHFSNSAPNHTSCPHNNALLSFTDFP